MMTYEEFKELQDAIVKVNECLGRVLCGVSEEERKPIDRVNDISLIVFMAFALEAFRRAYVGTMKRPERTPPSGVLLELKRKAASQGTLPQIERDLMLARPVMMIRNLWAHGAGRRSGVFYPEDLPPEILKAHHFETDGKSDDPDAQWWPTRFKSFRACVAPINKLAEGIRDHITP